MQEDSNSNIKPPAGTTVHESSPFTQNNTITDAGVADIVYECVCKNFSGGSRLLFAK